jgi:PAS domain-containing protein
MFENRVLRRIFGLKSEDSIRGWRELYNEELHNFCCSPNIIRITKIRRMRWAGHVARMRGEECVQGFDGESRKRPLGRSRHRWEDTFGEKGFDVMDLIHLVVVNPWAL